MAGLIWNTFLVFSVLGWTFGAEISSKIDLDDDPEEKPTLPSILSSSVLKAFVELNRGTGSGAEPSNVVLKESRQQGRFEQSRLEKSEDDSINIDEHSWNKKRQGGIWPRDREQVGSTIPSTIINNIHITVNGNDTSLGTKVCKNGVCDLSVSSNPDEDGNLMTDVHLRVVTKVNKVLKVGDVPVIDGFHEIENEGTSGFGVLPEFRFQDRQQVPFNVQLFDNNIPQVKAVPIHREVSEDFGSWYHVPKVLLRPRGSWTYARNLEVDRAGQQGHGTWTPSRTVVDDRVEVPFSDTKLSY